MLRRIPLALPLEPLLERLAHLRSAGAQVLVLAGGDPLFFGIGATMARQLGPEAVRILPATSSLQAACARLTLPWHRVICLSLHGRQDLAPLNAAAGRGAPLCILTDARMTPDVIARHLLDRGVPVVGSQTARDKSGGQKGKSPDLQLRSQSMC